MNTFATTFEHPAASLVLALILGFAAWPAVEYLVHGVLSHRFRTFVTPLHMGHHKNPRGVLTAPVAWVPAAALIWGALVLGFGVPLATAGIAGLLLGFARYERFHWRVHFDTPKSERERILFAHHLAHHYRDAKNYHGVTTRFFDRLMGTLPDRCEDDYASVTGRPTLAKPDDTFELYRPGSLRALIARFESGRGE
jgi:sterol desaturase/sphingolipid hydroxylase (fatty acid hydroxylase superfamily)